MRTTFLPTVALLSIILLVGCTISPTATSTPALTPTRLNPTKAPEPNRPIVRGWISGLPDDERATIYVRTLPNRVQTWGRRGNGPWEFTVGTPGGLDKIVTAEAERYASHPISYTIHLSGTTAYVVEDDQITSNEALHLNFHFKPANSP